MHDKKLIFTLTPGRTGTAYLANLLRLNLTDCESHHEIISGFDKVGIATPDIRLFHTFNSKGNTTFVKKFWKRKLENILKKDVKYYIETSHALMKAGLIENLSLVTDKANVYLVMLKRDLAETAESLYNLIPLTNVATTWFWLLDPKYPKNIVNPHLFKNLGRQGFYLWYIYETTARSEYYRKITEAIPNVSIVETNIENLNNKKGVSKLLNSIGYKMKLDAIDIPDRVNQRRNINTIDNKLIRKMKSHINKLNTTPEKFALEYIESGKSLG